jgi:hypothetical protein
MVIRAKTIVVRFQPPETYGGFVSKQVNPHLDEYTHFLILDSDTKSDFSAESIAERYGDADIVGFEVISSSRIFGPWEKMTYWLRIAPRIRGAAMLLSSQFLKRIGGYPDNEFVDTILLQKSSKTVVAPITVYHQQRFDLKHSVSRQISDGRFRANLRYPFWKTLLHSILRVRPFVFLSYIFHRIPRKKRQQETSPLDLSSAVLAIEGFLRIDRPARLAPSLLFL